MSKEQNFISAVIYFSGNVEKVVENLDRINAQLEEHFLHYEIIIVNNSRDDAAKDKLKIWGEEVPQPLTIINMSLKQSLEQCMNAGIDMAIGDYIYEFDSCDMPYDDILIWKAYEAALKGNDIVNCCPKNEHGSSRSFYYIFNSYSGAAYSLRTDAFRLVSRRALNRAHAISSSIPYRKATYATCGLKMEEIEFSGKMPKKVSDDRLELATDSLVLYTNFGYKFSISFTVLMMFIAALELIYTIVVWLSGTPIAGWTTTMFVLTLGLTGIFAVLAIAMKYLSLILRLSFKKQNYFIEGIEKV